MEWRGGALVAVSLIVLTLQRAARALDSILSCDVTSLEPCGDDAQQVCNATTGACQCLGALVMVEGRCAAAEGGSGAALGAAAALLLALVLLGTGVVLLLRRYPLLQWTRQHFARHSQTNAYEDVMIGADDPPLTL